MNNSLLFYSEFYNFKGFHIQPFSKSYLLLFKISICTLTFHNCLKRNVTIIYNFTDFFSPDSSERLILFLFNSNNFFFRFHHQALVEVKILDALRRKDKDSQYNIIHMGEYFYFRNHLCITFELMG